MNSEREARTLTFIFSKEPLSYESVLIKIMSENPSSSLIQDRPFSEITTGERHSQTYELNEPVYRHFMEAFSDANPIHIDEAYARDKGFDGRVMHGAILNGFLSHFVGMRFPGKSAYLQSVDIQYRSPSYLLDRLEIEAVVTQKTESVKVIVMDVLMHNRTRSALAASARVQVGFLK